MDAGASIEQSALLVRVAPAQSAAADKDFVNQFAREASGLGIDMAAIAGTLDDLGQLSRAHHEQLSGVDQTLTALLDTSQGILQAAEETDQHARAARQTMSTALSRAQTLAESAGRIAASVHEVTRVLNQVTAAAGDIGTISAQTRLVAFNASVEASRAGEAGRGFAVIASAVKDLSEKVQQSSRLIISTLSELGTQIARLEDEVAQNRDEGGDGGDITTVIGHTIATFDASFDDVQNKIQQICGAAHSGIDDCTHAQDVVADVAQRSLNAVQSVTDAAEGAGRVLRASEKLISLTAESGSITEDTPYIDKAIEIAGQISALFEHAVARGEIRFDDLFSTHYQEIPGTQPQQHLARCTPLTDRLLPPLQEAALTFTPKVVFCATVDRNGYLPTHNKKFSQPQGKDPLWNAANCRNRRIFNDRTGLAAGRNTQRFLLQTYRRDMGGGKFVIMKDVSAPIFVRGRHWGGVRLAYRTD